MVIHLYRKLEMKVETERGERERRERERKKISRRFGGTFVVKKCEKRTRNTYVCTL